MMRWLITLFLCLSLAACGAQPSVQMFGAIRHDIRKDGRDYVLYQKSNRVEVIRLGYAPAGSHQAIRATMIALIPEVTGCTLRDSSVQGDSGVMRGLVTCPRSSHAG